MNSPDEELNKQQTQDNIGEKTKFSQETPVDNETQTDLNNNVARSSIETLLGFVTPKEDAIHTKDDKVETNPNSSKHIIGETPIIGDASIIGERKESIINGNTYITFTPQPNNTQSSQNVQNVLHYYHASSPEPSHSQTMTPIRSICSVISPLSSHTPTPTQHVSPPRLHTTEQNLTTDMNVPRQEPHTISFYPQHMHMSIQPTVSNAYPHMQYEHATHATTMNHQHILRHHQIGQSSETQVTQQPHPILQQLSVQTNSHSIPTLHYPITNQQIKTQAVSEEERHRRRLERNRIAARQCRERKKAYVTNLETRVTRLEEENSRLRQQLGNLQTKLSYCPAEVQETLRLYCLVEDLKERLSNGQTIKTDPKIGGT
ncbi:28033_t:CDS:1 [Gigaspora margarita]|uniref:28033_t:CDS:1 n=2 Tax=Gigaspora margarita TaxID=4874 RepID=A0ABN7VIN9_GIGMA|nr:bzip transcription factor [Gigaspora margarita]CAG8776332.1 28033_t:CDS:1 [Gigaspora margarita]